MNGCWNCSFLQVHFSLYSDSDRRLWKQTRPGDGLSIKVHTHFDQIHGTVPEGEQFHVNVLPCASNFSILTPISIKSWRFPRVHLFNFNVPGFTRAMTSSLQKQAPSISICFSSRCWAASSRANPSQHPWTFIAPNQLPRHLSMKTVAQKQERRFNPEDAWLHFSFPSSSSLTPTKVWE